MNGPAARLAHFAAALRGHGVRIWLSDEIDAGMALQRVDLLDREEVRSCLRIALKIPREAWANFDRLFDEIWGGAPIPDVPVPPAADARRRPNPSRWRWDGARVRLDVPEPEPNSEAPPSYSPEQLLRRKPFDQVAEHEVAAIERILARLARRLAARRSRRLVPTSGRGLVDLRRSFRRTLGSGGEFLRLSRRARPLEEPRIVLLYDTSGSMDPYTRFHLAFAFALRRAIRGVEVFTFNTALNRVTRDIARTCAQKSLERLGAGVPDWSGGTRIGGCLAEFIANHGHRVNPGTTVVILSDGLDLGDTELLADSMRQLRARARSVIWLNPLLGDARYKPTAAGMRAALPHVSHFTAGHDLPSIERLTRLLN
jgi:uncharacterized protein with von Willebrand factor type A (vWA) domain